MSTLLEIGKNLKRIRLKQKLTQADVAEKAGINTNYYAQIERGETNFTINTFEKLLKALKTKSSAMLPF